MAGGGVGYDLLAPWTSLYCAETDFTMRCSQLPSSGGSSTDEPITKLPRPVYSQAFYQSLFLNQVLPFRIRPYSFERREVIGGGASEGDLVTLWRNAQLIAIGLGRKGDGGERGRRQGMDTPGLYQLAR